MKKILLTVICLILLSGVLHAAQYELVEDVEGLKVKVIMDNETLSAGENDMRIFLADSAGNPVGGAKIKVDYSMPPMGSMPPMIYKTRARHKGDVYSATLNLNMSGKWNVALIIKQPDRALARMLFELKVP